MKLLVDSIVVDTVRVERDGRAVFPRIGLISVARIPIDDVADSVRRAYSQAFRVPAVEVAPLIRVTALGELQRPDVLFVDPGSPLSEVVARAGGISPEGRRDRVTLIRDGRRQRVRDWDAQGSPPIRLLSGDAVLVEREPWILRNTFTLVSAASVLTSIVLALSR